MLARGAETGVNEVAQNGRLCGATRRAALDGLPLRAAVERRLRGKQRTCCLCTVRVPYAHDCGSSTTAPHCHHQAFCNACTTNNHNSSRFGKFVRLLVEPNGPVAGAAIDAYLLEKSRLVAQCDGERPLWECGIDRRGGRVGGEGQPHPPTPSITSDNIPHHPTHLILIVGERSFHVFYQLISDRQLCAGWLHPFIMLLHLPYHTAPLQNHTLCMTRRPIIQGAPSSNCSAPRRPTRPLTVPAAVRLSSRRAPVQMAPPRR